ncbi:uncharacterized protein BDW47DRAFT_113602 [Aspergillus candidus]|uniref:Uncharacterized protein n=1 Tax=Aspergillus candidus TaxID=41067 RepID=A0A2I2EYZ9_ASPCN|nr:hypothetical protein BDW47DRAFT_113602 [Aspergillus candidus]PLB33617.1 hypothetical protein BDW47DRAFT_113602 [Aspergillus candidus]
MVEVTSSPQDSRSPVTRLRTRRVASIIAQHARLCPSHRRWSRLVECGRTTGPLAIQSRCRAPGRAEKGWGHCLVVLQHGWGDGCVLNTES